MMSEQKTLNRREFLQVAGTAVTASLLPATAWASSSGVSTVPRSRLNRLAKGANVCRWFRGGPRSNKEQLSNYITEDEAVMMRKMGLSHVRLCLQPRVVMDQSTGAILADTAAFVDEAIKRFHRAGLLVLVDLHNEDRPSELNLEWQSAFVKFWSHLAARLNQFDPELTLFEIINEPVFKDRETEWNGFNRRLAEAIRKSAPNHTIMTSGPNWGGIDGLRKLELLEDTNVVYSFHCYDPFAFTHQGATWAGPDVKPLRAVPYPSSPEDVAPLLTSLEQFPGSKKMLEKYGEQRWNKAKLAARFKEGVEWGLKNKVPLYCGEFGVYPVYAKAEHRANWFRDFGQVLAENQIGWAVWGWDEGFGLNRKYVDGVPVVDRTVAASLGLKLD
ncbi:MAG TPA: cellulase family glycosylhydrolase [Verrucomicrobiae bacterium]|nr:cellulase family glycosylhydrolase [Verrucomicrobiae bacterium]